MKIFFVGLSGVPYASRACDIRLDSFALLFQKCGYDVTVLNRYSPFMSSKKQIACFEEFLPFELTLCSMQDNYH